VAWVSAVTSTVSSFHLLGRFSPQQQTVIQAGEGPLCVLAAPGSGKTTTLAGRIAYLVLERRVPPTSILAITFTTAAASAMRQHLAGVLGQLAHQVDIATFHALGLRLIRQWSHQLGYDGVPAVYGREDARVVLREAAGGLDLAVAPDDRVRPVDPWSVPLGRLASAVERFRLAGSPALAAWHTLVDGFDPDLLEPLSNAYDILLRERRAVDYAAMLAAPARLFQLHPPALELLQHAYRWVLVDEFQDTSALQYALLRQVVARHHNLLVTGDPNQCLYTWAGAEPRNLVQFSQQYPNARTVVLDQNFRSTGCLVALGNAIAAPLGARPDCWTSNPAGLPARLHAAADEAAEAAFVAGEIRRLLHNAQIAHAGQVAALVRTNAQTETLALALRAEKIPYHVRADSALLERPEVRDVVAYLRLAHSPSDVLALARIIDTPPRRLRAIEQALRRTPVPTAELPGWAQRRGGPRARQRVEQLLALIHELHGETQDRAPASALALVLERTGYRAWTGNGSGGEARLASLDAFGRLLAASSAPNLGVWLADLYLEDATGPAPDQAGAVTVSTIHRAKGLEWPVVFLLGVEDGLLPLDAAAGRQVTSDEEERRLAYVAVSRPQVLLYLTYCRTRRPIQDGEIRPSERRRASRYLCALPRRLWSWWPE
jgi:DNA helicase-2/ATP-dependent DNA helicase PcrA